MLRSELQLQDHAVRHRLSPEVGASALFNDQEVVVKVPRIQIAWVMVAVAFAALDFLAIRAFLDSPSAWGEELLLGALPMANVLPVGLLIGQRCPKSRPFVLGFELFGALALASYVAIALLFPRPFGPLYPYVSTLLDPIAAMIGRNRPFVFLPTACFVVVVMLALPQLALAVVGGFLARWYKVTVCITRR